jgi:hypothetical protein
MLEYAFGLLVHLIFLHYVYNLEKNNCTCSVDWRRTFIKYFSGILILQILLSVFLSTHKNKFVKQLLKVLLFTSSILGIVYLYSLVTYSMKLKNQNCECSKNIQREFMYWFSLVVFVLFALGVIVRTVAVSYKKAIKA